MRRLFRNRGQKGIFSTVSHFVGEGSVKGGFEVFDAFVDVAVHFFDFAGSACGLVKHLVEGVEVFGEDANVELAEAVGTEAELSALERPGFSEALLFEMVEILLDRFRKLEIFSAVDQIDPNRVDVHGISLQLSGRGRGQGQLGVGGSIDAGTYRVLALLIGMDFFCPTNNMNGKRQRSDNNELNASWTLSWL